MSAVFLKWDDLFKNRLGFFLHVSAKKVHLLERFEGRNKDGKEEKRFERIVQWTSFFDCTCVTAAMLLERTTGKKSSGNLTFYYAKRELHFAVVLAPT